MLGNFAGVKVTEPGAERVRIEPVYCSLTELDASVSTERGNVGVSYSHWDDSFEITVTVPSNVTAELVLPKIGGSDPAKTAGTVYDDKNDYIDLHAEPRQGRLPFEEGE